MSINYYIEKKYYHLTNYTDEFLITNNSTNLEQFPAEILSSSDAQYQFRVSQKFDVGDKFVASDMSQNN